MAITINGTTGVAGVDGSASTPAVQGSDTNTGVSFGTDTVNINTGGTTRATIDSSGRLLIGTTTEGEVSSDDLTIATAAHTGMTIRSGTSHDGTINFSDGTSGADEYRGWLQYNHTNNAMIFGTDATERMRIDSTGGLRVGTTSHIFNTAVNEQASIKQTDNGTALTLQATNITGGYPILWLYSSDTTASQNAITFQRTGGSVGTITTSASSTAYNTSSDYRLKENVIAISDGITRLKTLKPSRFNFKVDKDRTVDGFIAHEVTAVPEAVTGTKDEVDADNNPVYQGIDQSKLVPLLTAALQEAIAKIETLETKVAALEAA